MSKNIIIADGDHIDRVALNLTVNFERMLGRRIPQADMARWADCVALDGGVRQGDDTTRVVLIHDKGAAGLRNFTPGQYATELHGQAFKDHLGEFTFEAYPVEELTTKEDFFTEAVLTVCQQEDVKRIMIVPDEAYYNKVRSELNHIDSDKRITVFAMQPMAGGAFRQEILGYSLMAALGIRGDEISADSTN